MNRLVYEDLLRGVASLAGTARAQLDGTDAAFLREGAARRVAEAWEQELWPDLVAVEQRWFADFWLVGATYAVDAVVFYAPTETYYQSLQAGNIGHAPADANGVENSAYWATAATIYSGNDWASGVAYTVGKRVRYAVTGLFYQCIAAHTSSGGVTPSDLTKWGVLNPFFREVAYDALGSGAVLEVWDRHRDADARARRVPFRLRAAQVVILVGLPSVFVEFRIRPPAIFGAVFQAAATYAVGDQVYFSDQGTGSFRGDFWNCAVATAAGESPKTTPAKWAVVEIPAIFQRYLERGMYADYLTGNGQADKAGAEEGKAMAALARQVTVFRGQQRQADVTEVGTR